MPERPKTACRGPGCGKAARGGWCDACKAKRADQARHRRYNAGRTRDPALRARKRLYNGRKWKRLRAAFLRENPLCAGCLKRGESVTAREVDHVTPHEGDVGLFYSWGNLQGLCRPCHSRKTARENAGAAPSPPPPDLPPAL